MRIRNDEPYGIEVISRNTIADHFVCHASTLGKKDESLVQHGNCETRIGIVRANVFSITAFFCKPIDPLDPTIQSSNYFEKVTRYANRCISQGTENSDRCDRYESNVLAIPDSRFSLLTVDHEFQSTIRAPD